MYNTTTTNKWKNNCGIIWFYHIPKTGGSNFQYLMQQKLQQRYGKNINKSSYIFQYWTQKSYTYNASLELRNKLIPFIYKQLEEKNKIIFIHHHIWALSFTQLATRKGINLNYIKNIVINEIGCGFLFVTLIREPIAQTLSHIAYLWKMYPDRKKNEKTIQNALQQYKCYHNNQIKFLKFGYCPPRKNITKQILYETIQLMQYFDIIGIFERYNEFIKQILQITNLNITQNEFNQSIYKKRLGRLMNKEKITNIDIQTLNHVIKANSYDFPLYYHFYHQLK